jgi:hypothetical protein
MDLDCLLLTAIHLSVPNTLLISRTCTYIYKNIWKLKLQYHYPNKKYFDFWTGAQNYLVHCRGPLAIAVNFNGSGYMDKHIYEYDPMLEYILTIIDNANNKRIHVPYLIELDISDQFILIKDELCTRPKIFGQYETNDNAIKAMGEDQLKEDQSREYPEVGNFNYIIIDLELVTMILWKIKNKKTDPNSKNPCTYYNY